MRDIWTKRDVEFQIGRHIFVIQEFVPGEMIILLVVFAGVVISLFGRW